MRKSLLVHAQYGFSIALKCHCTVLTVLYFVLCIGPLLVSFELTAAAESPQATPGLINFGDADAFAARRPIIIAHRGGVVSDRSPECSLTAIRLAAASGYDMVELDVQKSSDGIPIVFHDRTLNKACGTNGGVADRTATELESISYLQGGDRITRLDTALKLCRDLRLGVMLDFKTGLDSQEFLELTHQLIVKHGLSDSAISFSGSDTARRCLLNVRFTPTDDEMRRLRAGESLDLARRFWFGIPAWLQPGDVEKLKSAGALVIPAINTFRYPADGHFELAKKDIKRLISKGADGFQIDSVYFSILSNKK